MRSWTLLFVLCLAPLVALPVTYHVSPTGNDSNNGTSAATAWRTIGRAQQATQSMQPGDAILFQRGGVYPGTLHINANGTEASPLVFGAYGTGAQPIISGGVPVTNWTRYQGDIWRASVPGNVKYVLVGNEPMTLARFPNTGWLRNTQGSTTQINAGGALNQPNGYWTGANLVVRTTNWSYDNVPVTGFNNGTLTFQGISASMNNNNWGFFLCNKLGELDMAGEWYHDAASGQLYLWAPGNADPNNLPVLASVHAQGLVPGWQRRHIRIENLVFQGQTASGISTEVSSHVTVTGCVFRHLYKAISSSGESNTYANNTIVNTFGTAINIYDSNTTVSGNTLTDCAVTPGLGENWWGYMGVYISGGNGNVVRGNLLENIGYIGIVANRNTLIERNVVKNATCVLNDGGGIAFDHADGMVVRDNIVLDVKGSLESVASNHLLSYIPLTMGIYFGNTSIRNTLVERNTVARASGAGIHVDHTMVSSGNRVRDNVMFDNGIQLSLSDFSNNTGTGAVAPYHVPAYNTVYSGNVMYSVRPEQYCMRHFNVYSADPVSFGTFSNNRYFSPYEELSIHIHNTRTAEKKWYTLERWREERNTDAGSTRSPLRLGTYATVSTLSGNLVVNGTFDQHVDGWGGYPANATVRRDMAYLDNGALRAELPSNAISSLFTMRNPDPFGVQSGQWYRMRFSLQSDVHGIVQAGVKGVSQFSGQHVVHQRQVPFSTERREVELYFQSGVADQAVTQFANRFQDPRYWLDNVELHRVTVRAVDPLEDHRLLVNELSTARSFDLDGCWRDLDGNMVTGAVTLQPYSSKVFYRHGEPCGVMPAQEVGVRVLLSGPLDTGTGLMRSDLHQLGMLPQAEPYTGLGVEVENSGATIASSLLQATGDQAIVDWVVLELRNPDAGYTVAARRAALVRANGQVVAADGSPRVTFTSGVTGRYLVVRHRNHLPVMAAVPLSGPGQDIDLTSPGTALYGQDALRVNGTLRSLWPGDVNGDGVVQYTGMWNDRDEVLVAIGSTVPSSMVQAYRSEDVNMDGVVRYVGTGNDRDAILTAIGGTAPTNVRVAQVP